MIRFAAFFALAFSLSVASGETIQSPLPSHRLLAEDGGTEDRFGFNVALSGDLALIASPADDDNGDSSGSVCVFDVTTGQQLRRLTPGDAAADDIFGNAVALSGTRAIIGAHFQHVDGSSRGSAYLFDAATGEQLAKLAPPKGEGGRRFGSSVAISDDIAVVGAYMFNSNGISGGGGAAFVFDATTGQLITRLAPDDTNRAKEFGLSVAIDGNRVLVGDVEDGEYGYRSGAVYVFDAISGQQLAKLAANDPMSTQGFGRSVSLLGNLALIGAPGDDWPAENTGAAYLFDIDTGEQLAKLVADVGHRRDEFGWSTSLSGNLAIISALREDARGVDSGAAYVFDVSTGDQIMRLTPLDDAGTGSWFGYDATIDGHRVVVGAPFDNTAYDHAGAAFVYEVIPEPGTTTLLACGALAGLIWWRRRR